MYRFSHFPIGKFQSDLFIQTQTHYGMAIMPYLKPFITVKSFTKLSCIGSRRSEVSNSLLKYTPSYTPVPPTLRRSIQDSFDNTNKCWNCNAVLKGVPLFCDSCRSLQPVDKEANFFNVLGIGHTYNLNQLELKQKFRNLQTLLHPDKFSSKPKKEQELSEEFSSTVNKAYSTLVDPLERGLYLLSLNNVSIEEGATDVDKMFLMEIMERNEEIENESDPQKLNKFNKVNREQLDVLIRKVSEAFDNNDIGVAKKLLTEMKYYNTIEKKIKDIKQKLNIPD